ncbi:MAG: alcohol dehydrogenase catalytic domain-containing protein [Christensenella sp.]|nr:alcohol dehydrogenase catalytic domain-containing protein [Christensenella sp.]
MKKTVLQDWGKLEVIDEPIPEIGEEEALIKLIYAGICGTDVGIYKHIHKSATVPRVLGHEYCGIIEKINSKKFPDLKAGDYVTSHPLNNCGRCIPCLTGSENVCETLQIYGIHADGCFAEYFKVPVRKISKIDPKVKPEVAALVEPLAVAVHDVRLSGLQRGDRALVVSAGPIGLLIGIVARMSGASQVILTEMNEYRIKLAQSFGFTVVNPTDPDCEKTLKSLTDGNGFHVVFEASGSKAGTELTTKVAAQKGMIVVVGVPKDPYPVDTGAFLAKELRMTGVRIHPQYDFDQAIKIINDGLITEELEKMVTNIFDLDHIEDAIKFSIEDQQHFKVLLKP